MMTRSPETILPTLKRLIQQSRRRVSWGVVLALVAAAYFFAAARPSPDENPYLFILVAICATLGSYACLFPKAAKRLWNTTIKLLQRPLGVIRSAFIGLFWLTFAALALWGIITVFAVAPIPASIIIGALIIAAAIAIKQSDD